MTFTFLIQYEWMFKWIQLALLHWLMYIYIFLWCILVDNVYVFKVLFFKNFLQPDYQLSMASSTLTSLF